MTDSGAGFQSDLVDTPPLQEKTAWWEDYIDIFYAPSAVFRRRAGSGFGMPLLIVTLVVAALYLATRNAIAPAMDAEFTRQMAKNPNITAAQMETGRAIGEKIGAIGAIVGVPIIIFLTGLFLWLAGKIVNSKATLAQALMVAAYANVIRIVQAVLTGAQGLFLPSESLNGMNRLSLGPARFLDADTSSALVMLLAMRLDLIVIWITVLLAIGLAVVGKIPRGQAAIAALIVWLIAMLPQLPAALR